MKPRQLSDHAKAALRDLAAAPRPRQSINPGLVALLLREGLAESVQLPSPFKIHKGKSIEHLCIPRVPGEHSPAPAGTEEQANKLSVDNA